MSGLKSTFRMSTSNKCPFWSTFIAMLTDTPSESTYSASATHADIRRALAEPSPSSMLPIPPSLKSLTRTRSIADNKDFAAECFSRIARSSSSSSARSKRDALCLFLKRSRNQGGVVAAEAERVVHHHTHFLFFRFVSGVIEIALRVRIFQIDRGRNHAVADR